MGVVVQMFSGPDRTPDPVPAIRERRRREDVRTSLQAMLDDTCRDEPRLRIEIRDLHDGLAVAAVIDGRSELLLTSSYPIERIDGFAMVVRGRIVRWRTVLARRLSMRSVD